MAVRRIADEPAFILHSYPFSESSLILEVFTRSHGRVVLLAKGAKKPTSNFRPVLLPLQPLRLSWSVSSTGDGEVHALKGAASLIGAFATADSAARLLSAIRSDAARASIEEAAAELSMHLQRLLAHIETVSERATAPTMAAAMHPDAGPPNIDRLRDLLEEGDMEAVSFVRAHENGLRQLFVANDDELTRLLGAIRAFDFERALFSLDALQGGS